MKKYEYQRGAILVESALVVGAIFLMLFGTVFLSIIGFDQMSADGASYEVAHQTSVGASAPPAQAAHNTFPNIPQSNITTTVQPAPDSSIAVDYGYNDPNVDTVTSGNNRHGGVGVMQGASVSGAANKSSAAILGMPIQVVGNMVEPMWIENGLHFNAQNANGDAYGAAANACTTPPPGSSAPSRCFQGNVFSQGENAPMYYTSINVLVNCSSFLPWGTNISGVSQSNPDVCSASQEQYVPMGVAEFLDLTNWCPSSGAVAPCENTPLGPGLAATTQSQATFADINCHQRTYKKIADFFATQPTLQKALTYQTGNANDSNPYYPGTYDNVNQSTNAPGPPFYYYALRDPTNATSGGHSGSNTFAVFAGFDTPASGENLTNPSAAVSGATDMAIRRVYSWDGSSSAAIGAPNPLYPDSGCQGA